MVNAGKFAPNKKILGGLLLAGFANTLAKAPNLMR